MGEYIQQVWYLKQGDTLPAFATVLKQPNGDVFDLSGSTAWKLYIYLSSGVLLTRDMVIVNPPGTDGMVAYAPQASDWDAYSSGGAVGGFVPGPVPPLQTVGGVTEVEHRIEYEVTNPLGTITFPNNGYDILRIYPDLTYLGTLRVGMPTIESTAVLYEPTVANV